MPKSQKTELSSLASILAAVDVGYPPDHPVANSTIAIINSKKSDADKRLEILVYIGSRTLKNRASNDGMRFQEAITAIQQGFKVRRPCWDDGSYWGMMNGAKIVTNKGDVIGGVAASTLFLTGWEIVK